VRENLYQVHLWIRQISPMIWRRALVHRESTLAQIHDVIQIVFGWSDTHLHRFRIHGRDYEVSRDGGPWFSQDARQVRLVDFQFRPNQRFLYEDDFSDRWRHEVRIERGFEKESKRTYPVCIGGQRAAPPEDCGGPRASLERCDSAPWQVHEHLEHLTESINAGDLDAARDHLEAIESLREWIPRDPFDLRAVNHRLRL
jgi:hypothetical protein